MSLLEISSKLLKLNYPDYFKKPLETLHKVIYASKILHKNTHY